MKRMVLRFAAVTLLVVTGACASMSGQDAGWVTLLDGSNPATLENWIRVGDANWRVEDGVVVADKGTDGYLVTKRSYGDFQIRAEFWAEHSTNSAVFIRAENPTSITPFTGYEANIWDDRPDPSYGTGGIVGVAKVSPMPRAGDKWNTYLITAQGPHLTVELNGIRTVDIQDAKHTRGRVALQYGSGADNAPGGPIKFRRVEIRPL